MDDTNNSNNPNLWRDITLLVLFYFIAARVGQYVAIPPGSVTPFWPAAGLILCAVLLKGYRIWPGIYLGAIVGNSWAYADFSSVSTFMNFLIAANFNAVGDTLCALFGAYMIKRGNYAIDFVVTEKGVIRFILFAAIVGSLISASFGVTGLCLGNIIPWSDFVYTWITWTVGDGVGMLVIAPLILAMTSKTLSQQNRNKLWPESIFLLLITAALFYVGFDTYDILPTYLPILLVFPILILTSLRYGVLISFAVVTLISIIAIAKTAAGQGVFLGKTINESLIELQLFVAVATLTTLFLNAVIFQRLMFENSLQHSNTELEAANKELEAFGYSLSHDLRTPTRSIVSFSQLIKEDAGLKLNTKERDYLDRIIRSGKHMSFLINDVIALSLVSHSDLTITKVNVSEMCNEITRSLKEIKPDRKCEFHIQNDISALADQRLLSIAMQNLLANSWKFTSTSELTIIEFKCFIENKEMVYAISDNGAGFDDTYKDKLFRVFQRLHSESEFTGSGIGLATVQRIIKRHGGRVWAESKPGQGATFYFTLTESSLT